MKGIAHGSVFLSCQLLLGKNDQARSLVWYFPEEDATDFKQTAKSRGMPDYQCRVILFAEPQGMLKSVVNFSSLKKVFLLCMACNSHRADVHEKTKLGENCQSTVSQHRV